MAEPNLVTNDHTVEDMRYVLIGGKTCLQDAPAMVTFLLKTEAWKIRTVKRLQGRIVEFKRFKEFVEAPPLEGLGATLDIIYKLVSDDPVALDLLDRETVGPKHLHRDHGEPDWVVTRNKALPDDDNIIIKPALGTSRQYALRRLRKQRPDLHQRVLDGELSPHAAMIEAGFRHKATPLERLRADWKKASTEEKLAFLSEVSSQS